MAIDFGSEFPKLTDIAGKKTSEIDSRYNCIAWAFGDNRRHWWPHPRSYWPIHRQNLKALECFKNLFAIEGWEETKDSNYEHGFTKIALYTRNGEPTHAARQLPSGLWTSKLGGNIDLSHQLDELDGPSYGSVYRIYKKANSPIVL
jgi:hypothetical protein